MQGLFLPGLFCLVLCLNYVSARGWTHEALHGLTCEDKCDDGKCSEQTEYYGCRCIPEKYVNAINATFGMPLHGPMVCLYVKKVERNRVSSKCCHHYNSDWDYRFTINYFNRYQFNKHEPKRHCIRLLKIHGDVSKIHGWSGMVCRVQKLRDNSPRWKKKTA